MNLANKMTMLRILLVPIFLFFFTQTYIPYGILIASVIFIIASLTDTLDGFFARKYNQVTRFGKFLDPLADKLLVTAALIGLVECGSINSWVAFIIIAREFMISGLRILAAAEGIVIAASKIAKVKTVIQLIAILLALFNLNLVEIEFLNIPWLINFTSFSTNAFMILAVIFTIVSAIDYFYKNKKVLNDLNV
ncbi:MAG: CDP-diacylglycerol--glycerol-3-phosphate 3-phosphatidyltransferase [Oscillospiraceae bacterium]|nr:CDP-diacylglycerol--glycerol-3-phosphate 3-phosphatidyltransferase [Oscillospiraceae bacterium]